MYTEFGTKAKMLFPVHRERSDSLPEKSPGEASAAAKCFLALLLLLLLLLLAFAIATVLLSLQKETFGGVKAGNSSITSAQNCKQFCHRERGRLKRSPSTEESGSLAGEIAPNGVCSDPIVPGLTWMSRGVDITTLDLFPANLRTEHGYKGRLFDLTCWQNHTWRHPTLTALPEYSLPDQVVALNTVPAGPLNIKSQFYSNLRDVKESLGVSVGVNENTFPGSFSGSMAYKEARESLLVTNKSLLETSATVSVIQMDFEAPSSLQLNHKFREMLQNLPRTYESAPEVYDHFVDTFGTHYFESAKFGGYLLQKTTIENAYLYGTSERQLHDSLKRKFLSFITEPVATAAVANEQLNNSKLANEEFHAFQTNTEVDFYFFGGTVDLGKVKDSGYLHDWQNGVLQDPWLFAGQLAPIESLIQNETLQGEVKKAVAVKLGRAYLKDLRDTLVLGKVSLSDDQLKRLETLEDDLNAPKEGKLSEISQIEREMVDLFEKVDESRDRDLLSEFAHRLDGLWVGELLDAKYNFTVEYCIIGEIQDHVKAQYDWLRSLTNQITALLNNPTGPKLESHSIHELVRQVGTFLSSPVAEQFKETGAFCGGDVKCRRCTQDKIPFEGNWKRYATFYGVKVYSIWDGALACKDLLADYCRSYLQMELDGEYARWNQLYHHFYDALKERKAANKWQMEEWIQEGNAFIAKMEAPIDLCSPNSPCQECLQYNVDCWNSNPAYLRVNSGKHCKTPEEWKAIKYTPNKMSTLCQTRYL